MCGYIIYLAIRKLNNTDLRTPTLPTCNKVRKKNGEKSNKRINNDVNTMKIKTKKPYH